MSKSALKPGLKPRKKKEVRVRRTAEDARTEILDATERRLVASGPNGIRLQDVAKDVGVGHSAILHHFGSRERLVEAVIQRRVRAMNQEVILTLVSAGQAGAGEAGTAIALFERLYEMFARGGHARVVAYLALEGRVPGAAPESLAPIAQATHAARVSRRAPGTPEPTFEDTSFVVLLAALALFGEAIVGPLFRGEPEDRPDVDMSKRFREWVAKLTLSKLES